MDRTAKSSASHPRGRGDVPAALIERLGYLLGQAHLIHRRTAEAELAPLELGVKEFGALSVLVDEGTMSQQRLGERMRVDRTTMVMVVDQLENGGFVTRERSAQDRRAYSIRPTAQGRRVLKRAAAAAGRAEAEFLAPISTGEQRQLVQLLQQLTSPDREAVAAPIEAASQGGAPTNRRLG